MYSLIFNSTEPQPVSLAGGHLRALDALYCERLPGLTTLISSRMMVVGAAIRAVLDSINYTGHALNECWQNTKITQLAMNSFDKAGRHLVLSVFSVTIGIFFPSLAIQLADRADLIPPHPSTLTEGVKAVGWMSFKAAQIATISLLCFAAARFTLMTDEERAVAKLIAQEIIRPIVVRWVQPLSNRIGDLNLKAIGLATGFLSILKIARKMMASPPPRAKRAKHQHCLRLINKGHKHCLQLPKYLFVKPRNFAW